MEIVLGILLLFGAFTLGTDTSDTTDHNTETQHLASGSAGQPAQTVTNMPTPLCRSGQAARSYRDLTVPITDSDIQHPTPTQDEEVDDHWEE